MNTRGPGRIFLSDGQFKRSGPIFRLRPQHGTPAPGHPLRGSQAGRQSGFRGFDRRHAGVGHRREHGDVQRPQRRLAAAAGLPRTQPADVHHQPVPESRVQPVLGVLTGVPGVPRLEPCVLVGRGLFGAGGESGRRSSGATGHGARHQRVDADPRGPAAARTHLHHGRHAARGRRRRNSLRHPVAHQLWRGPGDPRQDADDRWSADAGCRSHAAGLRRPWPEGRAVAAADARSQRARQSGWALPVSDRPAASRDVACRSPARTSNGC